MIGGRRVRGSGLTSSDEIPVRLCPRHLTAIRSRGITQCPQTRVQHVHGHLRMSDWQQGKDAAGDFEQEGCVRHFDGVEMTVDVVN